MGLAELANVSPVELFAIVYDLKSGEGHPDDLARYAEIIAALENINDEGLRLLVDQIRFVLRARYPRRST